MIRITDQDIERVEKLLLPDGCVFNEERRKFIRCMESCDVVACPGSGKTTALLAKILILASKMPFSDNRSICVLTHTNVAIDKIKSRLGTEAENLFRYPNFFGTIQTFINHFLAIPAYRNEFNQALLSIDWDIYFNAIDRIYSQNIRRLFWLEHRGGSKTLASYWFSPTDLSIQKNLDTEYIGVRNTTSTYTRINDVRRKILNSGILSYNDAYSLALRYILSNPVISKAFYNRFRFIFIDEMQDTDSHQLKVFEQIFNKNRSIVQRIGDPNQAIYLEVRKDNIWLPESNVIRFSDTKRFGMTITKIIDTIRVDRQISLKENPDINSLTPYILTYTEDTIDKVLPSFATLIRKKKLHKNKLLKNPVFKAVGWVGKDKTEEDKICLRSYFQRYRKSIKNRKQYFSNLISYLYKPLSDDIKNVGAKIYKDAIIHGIVHAITIGKVNNPKSNHPFTQQTFLRWMREEKESAYRGFLEKLSEWIIQLYRGERTRVRIKDEIATFIRNTQCIEQTNTLTQFLSDNKPEYLNEEQESSNIFKTDDEISIEVGTVHSVKGETHTATLYLETFNYDLDSKRLLPFLKGEYPKKESKLARHRENLKIAHVAFSRPTHLVAFACTIENINGHEKELSKNGWSIINV